jgi:hypothetical protein
LNKLYNRNLIFRSTSEFVLLIFLTLVFTIPRAYSGIKLLFILICIFLIIANLSFNKPNAKFLLYALLIIAPSILVAMSLNNDVYLSINSFKLYYIFPIFLYLIFLHFEREYFFKILIHASFLSLVFSFIINSSTILHFLGLFPLNLNYFFYPEEDRIGFNDGFVHMVNSSFSYWIYTIPLLFVNGIRKSKIRYGFLFLTFVLAIFSGRRIIILPYLLVLIYNFKSIRGIAFLVFSSFLIYFLLVNFEFFNLDIMLDRFIDAVAGRGDSEARSEQHEYFWKYIGEKPFFGHGLGSFMPNYLRSESFKTAYENTFDYLLFERGFIGVCLLFLFLSKLFINVYVNSKNLSEHVPILTATGALLLASYTNPYWLSSFDYTVPFAILMRFADPR